MAPSVRARTAGACGASFAVAPVSVPAAGWRPARTPREVQPWSRAGEREAVVDLLGHALQTGGQITGPTRLPLDQPGAEQVLVFGAGLGRRGGGTAGVGEDVQERAEVVVDLEVRRGERLRGRR